MKVAELVRLLQGFDENLEVKISAIYLAEQGDSFEATPDSVYTSEGCLWITGPLNLMATK